MQNPRRCLSAPVYYLFRVWRDIETGLVCAGNISETMLKIAINPMPMMANILGEMLTAFGFCSMA
jgi:hypothetical protein